MDAPRGGIAGLLDTILELLGVHLEPWMAPAAVVAGALLLLPLLLRNQNTARARRVLGRLTTATTAAQRAAIEAEAFSLVRGNVDGLVALADAAQQRGRTDLARRCVEGLRELGGRPAELRRLVRQLDGDFPATVEEVVVRIGNQRDAGLHVAAAETLARAEARWPGHPELVSLREATTPSDGPSPA